jgi:RimJ/RimL family protein N-acetyltransferase
MAVVHTERLTLREFRDSAFARPDNQASLRVLAKCGFRFIRYEPTLQRNRYEVGRQEWRETLRPDGRNHDS